MSKENMIAMAASDFVTHAREHAYQPEAALVYCGLFGDRVAERVCLLLKEELNAWWRCDLACRGCGRRWLRRGD
jgi:hypothetical protein